LLGKYKKALEFWTAGANEGEFCDEEKVYSWCPSDKRVRRTEINTTWVNPSREPTSSERCLSLQMKVDAKYGLSFSNCTSKFSAICEVGHIEK